MDTSVPLPTLQTLMPLNSVLTTSNKKILENKYPSIKTDKNVIPNGKHANTFCKLLVFQNHHKVNI